MTEVIVGVFCTVVGVVVLAAVGHLLWVGAEKAIRWINGERAGRPAQQGSRCSACGAPAGIVAGRCRYCGFQPDLAPAARLKSELETTSRVLARWAEQGLLNTLHFAELQQVLAKQREQMGMAPLAVRADAPLPLELPETALPETASPAQTTGIDYLGEVLDAVVVTDADAPSPAPSCAPEYTLAPLAPREVHPLDRDYPATPAAPAGPSLSHRARRRLADVMQSFMEDKNIRWGELVAGLLIVGSAIGCVISLQDWLRDADPYVPASIFLAATAAIFGVGTYTLRRWDLQSVSRAILIISLLLIPLNFLTATSSPEKRAVADPLFLLAVALGLGAFGTICWFAGRMVVRDAAPRLTLAVMGAAASQLYLSRLAGPEMGIARASLLFAPPALAFTIALIWQTWRASHWKALTPRRAEQALGVAGIGAFSLAAAAGLLMHRVGNPMRAAEWLSPTLSVVGAAVVALGLSLARRAVNAKHVAWRTTSLAVALLGAALMTANLTFAWPEPSLLIVVGGISFLALASLAAAFRQPALHFPAIGCFTLAYLVGFHLLQHGEYDLELGRHLLALLWMGRSAAALGALAFVACASGACLAKLGRRDDGLNYLLAGGALATASIALSLGVGFLGGPDAHWATSILAVYTLALLAAAVVRSLPAAAAGGAILLLATAIHGLALNTPLRAALERADLLPQRPVLWASLLTGLACAAVAAALAVRRRLQGNGDAAPTWQQLAQVFQPEHWRNAWRRPESDAIGATAATLTFAAVSIAVLAAPFAIALPGGGATPNAAAWAAISAVLLVAALVHRQAALASAFGWASTVAVVFATTAVAQRQDWWNGEWQHPRHLQWLVSSLAIWSVLWSAARRLAERGETWRRVLNPPWAAADQIGLGLSVGATVLLAILACAPGIGAELGFPPGDPISLGGAGDALLGDSGAWIALAIVVAAVVGTLAAHITFAGLLELTIALAAIPLLAAAQADAGVATASAARWWFALYGAALAAVLCARRPIAATAERLSWLRRAAMPSWALETLRSTAFGFTLLAVLGLTITATVQFLTGATIGGPTAPSIFAAMPLSVLYAGPLLALVAILIAYALREQTASYLAAASVLFQTTATLACLLAAAPLGDAIRTRVAVLQWNAAALGAFSLVWLALQTRILRTETKDSTTREAVDWQLAGAMLAVGGLGIWSAWGVFVQPANPLPDVRHLGQVASYLALAMTAAAGVWRTYKARPAALLEVRLGGGWVLGALLAASLAAKSSPQVWISYYVLLGASLATVIAATVITAFTARSARKPADAESPLLNATAPRATLWASVLGFAVVVLAIRAVETDPWTPWWSAGSAFLLACCAAVLSVARNLRGFTYAGTALAALGATFIALGPFIGLWQRDAFLAWLDLLNANILAAVAAGGISLAYFLRRRNSPAPAETFFAPPVHSAVAVGATAVLAIVSFLGLLVVSLSRGFGGSTEIVMGNWFGILTALSLGALLIASLWNPTSRYAAPCLYVWGGTAIALGLDRLHPDLQTAVFALVVSASAYAMLTGLLWRSGIGIAKFGAQLGIPDPVGGLERIARWLPGVTALQALPWTFLAFWMVLGYADRGMRYGAALAPLMLAIGIGSLAQLQRQRTMQTAALLLATIAAVFFGWADIAPDRSAEVWLARSVRLLIVLSAVAAAYGGVVSRLLAPEHAWRGSIRRMTVVNGAAALASLAAVLCLEWGLFEPGVGVPGIEGPQILAVAVVLAALAGAFVSMALLPQRDPLSLSEDHRVWYVYTAEAIAALLFAHLYLTLPELFSGVLRQYWAYIVVAIAYVGVGLGELFRRSGVRVLAEPLGRTGVFLPLLPAIAFWAQSSLTGYAGALFWIGLLYVLLSIQHKSFAFGAAAGLAGNAALWALMQDRHFTFLAHPQFWLIPPAVSALTAAHLTRDQLKESQLAAIRYVSMLVIYLSSTGEMFIAGLGESLWPVMVLAGLSVAGVLTGIGLRVRAFLYLGAGFLTLSVVGMVWHASKALEHVWPWWAFLFTLGVAILALFAVFEKRRDLFLQRIANLQTWEL